MRKFVCFLSSTLILVVPVSLSAEEFAAARLLPESVVIYAEAPFAGDSLGDLLDHPQRQKIEALPKYQEWLEGEERRQLMMGVRFIEAQLGMPWRRAIEKLGEGGVYFALDGASRSIAILVKSDDAAFLKKSHDTLLDLVRADGAEKRKSDPLKSIDYRGVQAFRADNIRFAISGKWLILASSDALGKSIIDHILDDSERSLAQNDRFRTAHASRGAAPLAWAYADLATIRSAGIAKPLLGGKASDPGAELIFGGVLNTLHNAPFATVELTSEGSSIDLALTLPHDPSWTHG